MEVKKQQQQQKIPSDPKTRRRLRRPGGKVKKKQREKKKKKKKKSLSRLSFNGLERWRAKWMDGTPSCMHNHSFHRIGFKVWKQPRAAGRPRRRRRGRRNLFRRFASSSGRVFALFPSAPFIGVSLAFNRASHGSSINKKINKTVP